MSRGGAATLLLLVLGAQAPAGAHWVPPEAVVAELNGPPGRSLGVDTAVRDPKAPRLLVIRVGDGWYRLSAEKRRSQAAAWLDAWRRSVPQGVVSVLDEESDRPVVHFAPGGRVAGIEETRSRNRPP